MVQNYSSYDFQVKSVLQSDTLNLASLGANSNKFYIMELQLGTGIEPYCIYTRHGRMGAHGRENARYFKNQYQAESEYQKLRNSKLAKGYKKVELEGESPGTTTQTFESHVPNKKREKELEKIQDKVLKFIGRLYTHATEFTTKSIETPLGAISARQVARGYNILEKIEEAILNKTGNTLYLSDEFYSVIPAVFGSRVDVQKMRIDSLEKINEKKDLLDVMGSVVQAQDSLEKTLEEKYASLKIDLNVLSKRTKEFGRLKKWVESSQSKNHSFNINVTDIFEVNDMVGHDKFNPYKVSTMELFHGSRNENILSIMQNGLQIKPRNAAHTGSMFGNGVYFAENSSKSANYCWGFNRAELRDRHYLFVCEVATGRIKEYDSPQSGLNSAPYGYNSVLGKKGSYLQHNEYIIYKPSQVRVKYIIEFEKV